MINDDLNIKLLSNVIAGKCIRFAKSINAVRLDIKLVKKEVLNAILNVGANCNEHGQFAMPILNTVVDILNKNNIGLR